MDCQKQLEYIGNTDQLISVREGRLAGGRQEGVHFTEISNGAGLEITVLPDRCMDLYQIRVNGQNINYIAPCGIAAPQYYSETGNRFLRNFFVGFLTTCGLQNIGVPCAKNGQEYGLHGRISNTPAEQFHCAVETSDGAPRAVLSGTMKEAVIFGENLSLHRKITIPYGKKQILLEDTVTNHSFRKTAFMMLYHFNVGYPLLDENAELLLDSESITPRNEHAARHAESWRKIEPPQDNFEEMCYYHRLKKDADGFASYSVYQPRLDLGVRIKFDAEKLDRFCQWKMFGKGEYVMGLEPMNSYLEGRCNAAEQSELKELEAQESITHRFEISFYSRNHSENL